MENVQTWFSVVSISGTDTVLPQDGLKDVAGLKVLLGGSPSTGSLVRITGQPRWTQGLELFFSRASKAVFTKDVHSPGSNVKLSN